MTYKSAFHIICFHCPMLHTQTLFIFNNCEKKLTKGLESEFNTVNKSQFATSSSCLIDLGVLRESSNRTLFSKCLWHSKDQPNLKNPYTCLYSLPYHISYIFVLRFLFLYSFLSLSFSYIFWHSISTGSWYASLFQSWKFEISRSIVTSHLRTLGSRISISTSSSQTPSEF